MMVQALRSTCARKCSSRSCGSMTPATRTRAARDWDLRSLVTSPARMAATLRSATVRWVACARQCEFRYERLLLATREHGPELVHVLDVELEATAGHHDVTRLLIRFAGPQPFRLDLGHGIARCSLVAEVAMRGGRDRVGGVEVAVDFRMRGDRNAGDAAERIAHIAGCRLLDVLLGADLLGHRRDHVVHVLVGGLVSTMLHGHIWQRRAGP